MICQLVFLDNEALVCHCARIKGAENPEAYLAKIFNIGEKGERFICFFWVVVSENLPDILFPIFWEDSIKYADELDGDINYTVFEGKFINHDGISYVVKDDIELGKKVVKSHLQIRLSS